MRKLLAHPLQFVLVGPHWRHYRGTSEAHVFGRRIYCLSPEETRFHQFLIDRPNLRRAEDG